MQPISRKRWLAATVIAAFVANIGAIQAAPAALAATPVGQATAVTTIASPIKGPPGFAMAEPARTTPGPFRPVNPPKNGSLNTYTHTPGVDSSQNLPAGSGPIMPSTTIYYDF